MFTNRWSASGGISDGLFYSIGGGSVIVFTQQHLAAHQPEALAEGRGPSH
ncbi:hypothetical protein SJI19_14075 [Acerihabitans sp. TG2]|nr:hypothetical protein [Acerihabitans sp. TG2]MEA9391658.1 hypothetical protein [Acerihabitans sp. TG2]